MLHRNHYSNDTSWKTILSRSQFSKGLVIPTRTFVLADLRNIFRRRRDATSIFRGTTISNSELNQSKPLTVRVTRSTTTSNPNRLNDTSRSNHASIASEPRLVSTSSTIPCPTRHRLALIIVIVTSRFVRSNYQGIQRVLDLRVEWRNLPRSFYHVDPTSHLFRRVLSQLNQWNVGNFVPTVTRRTTVVANFRVSSRVPNQLVVTNVRTHATSSSRASTFRHVHHQRRRNHHVVSRN